MANNMELVFILDRSGSMGGLEDDTIGGYNSFLKKQQDGAGDARITTVLFNDGYELLHDRLDIRAVGPITDKEYFARGSTALLDAVGRTIRKVENVHKGSSDEYKPGKVLFVITTDGMENASRRYSCAKVKSMIEEKKELGWEFVFLGANIDAVDVADRIGIDACRAANYHADKRGLRKMYSTVGDMALGFRGPEAFAIDDSWAEEIEEDFRSREKD